MKQKTFLDAVNDSTAKMYWKIAKPYVLAVVMTLLIIAMIISIIAERIGLFFIIFVIIIWGLLMLAFQSLKNPLKQKLEPDEYDNFHPDQEI